MAKVAANTLRKGMVVEYNNKLWVVMENELRSPGKGAAVAQVCHEWGVPCAAIRTISDRADDAASVDFMQFITQVDSRYSVAVLRQWLSRPDGS